MALTFRNDGQTPPGILFNSALGVYEGTPDTLGLYLMETAALNADGEAADTWEWRIADAPLLLTPIPDQSYIEGANIVPIDIDTYFQNATEGYTATPLPTNVRLGSHHMTVGTDGASAYGYTRSAYGALVLDTVAGILVDYLRVTSANVVQLALVGGVQIPGMATVDVDVGTASYTLTWTGSIYSVSAPGATALWATWNAAKVNVLVDDARTRFLAGWAGTAGSTTTVTAYSEVGSVADTFAWIIEALAAPTQITPYPDSVGYQGYPANFYYGDGYWYSNAGPITFSLNSGTLPSGLSLTGATGMISGTPTTVQGPNAITLLATNSEGATVSDSFTIQIVAGPPPAGSGGQRNAISIAISL